MELLVNRAFTSRYNPFMHLGQIAIFLLLLTAISGIYVLPFYSINAQNAYISVNNITEDRIAGIMRSIHRYSADALIIVLILHGIRTLITRRLLQSRWLVWVSGVLLFGAVLIEGLTGYWMVWDQRAQLVALGITEFLDELPVFPKPLAMSVAGEESLTSLLFFAVVFTHLALPLFSSVLLLLHFSRLSGVRLLPPERVAVLLLAVLLTLSLLKPAISAPPATPYDIPVKVPVDWYYMLPLPLMQSHPRLSWLLLIAITAFLLAVPRLLQKEWLSARIRRETCTGCELCYADCPYGAISMLKDGEKKVASVSGSRCAGCGICVGSCSFNAVEFGDTELELLRKEVKSLAERDKTLVVICRHCLGGKAADRLMQSNVKVLSLRCIGMLHPLAVADALDAGVNKLVIAGCKHGDCRYRFGNLWTEDRLSGRRAPVLKHPEAGRVRLCWLMPGEEKKLISALEEGKCDREKPAPHLILMLLLLFTLPLSYFSTSPAYSLMQADKAMLLFTMSHPGERLVPCREPTVEELRAGNLTPCPRERSPVEVVLAIDGRTVLRKSYQPSGLWRDGPSYAYERIEVEPGEHTLEVRIRDSAEGEFRYRLVERVRFERSRVVILKFEKGRFHLGDG